MKSLHSVTVFLISSSCSAGCCLIFLYRISPFVYIATTTLLGCCTGTLFPILSTWLVFSGKAFSHQNSEACTISREHIHSMFLSENTTHNISQNRVSRIKEEVSFATNSSHVPRRTKEGIRTPIGGSSKAISLQLNEAPYRLEVTVLVPPTPQKNGVDACPGNIFYSSSPRLTLVGVVVH